MFANETGTGAIRPRGDVARLETDDALRAKKLRAASEQFEAVFMKMLLESMRKSMPEGFFGTSFSADIHGSLVEHELSRKLSERGSLGIADALYEQLAPAAGLAERPAASAAHAYRRAGGRPLAPIEIERIHKDGDDE
jgi:Rod binding domain-containing protein